MCGVTNSTNCIATCCFFTFQSLLYDLNSGVNLSVCIQDVNECATQLVGRNSISSAISQTPVMEVVQGTCFLLWSETRDKLRSVKWTGKKYQMCSSYRTSQTVFLLTNIRDDRFIIVQCLQQRLQNCETWGFRTSNVNPGLGSNCCRV